MKELTLIPCLLISICLSAQPIVVTEHAPDSKSRHYRLSEFQEAEVALLTGNPVHALMNYNLLTEEMIIGVLKARTPYPASDNILYITLGDIKYITRSGKYYEVLSEGTSNLLVQRKMIMGRLGQNTGLGRTTNRVSTELPPILSDKSILYQLQIPGEYSLKSDEFYFVEKDGVLNPLQKLKVLEKIFPASAAEIKKHIKDERLRISREEDIIQAFEFCLNKESQRPTEKIDAEGQ